jgi:UDP-N-acetyl-2-amino-2-deoxyglucuronate dehydrogenase
VCDVDPAALRAAVEKTGARGHHQLAALLAKSKADCVILTTPSGLHPPQAAEAARAGFDVMTEKPMATRWSDGLAMVRACDEGNVRLFVVKQNRRNRTLQLLKEAVDKGRFGRIYMVGVNVFWTRPQAYYDSSPWRGTWEFDGGAFMNQASHYVDLLDWIIGPVESVMAYTGTLARNIEVEDTGVAALKWRNGAMGSINVTMLTYPKNLEGSITILGERGSVRIGGVAVNEIKHWEFDSVDPMDAQIHDASYQTTSVYGFGHPLYYDNVISTLRGGAEPETDGREGLKSLELLIAMYLSARDGKRVSLPLAY